MVAAAGKGERMGASCPKVYLPLLGKPALCHGLASLATHGLVKAVFLVLAPDDEHLSALEDMLSSLPVPVFACKVGGGTRAQSVLAGLGEMGKSYEDTWVLIHDGARPLIEHAWINALWQNRSDDGAILAVPASETLKEEEGGRIRRSIPREKVWLAQTPQLFRLGLLAEALKHFPDATDEAQAMERAGWRPRLVPGSRANLKITYPEDLALMECLLSARGKKP